MDKKEQKQLRKKILADFKAGEKRLKGLEPTRENLLELAVHYVKYGKVDKAIDSYERVLKMLADTMASGADNALAGGAERTMAESADNNSTMANILVEVANLHMFISAYDKAEKALLWAREITADNIEVLEALGACYIFKKQYDNALALAINGIELTGGLDARFFVLQAYALDSLGKYKSAEQAFLKALELEPDNEDYKSDLENLKTRMQEV
ncbi:MAG: tetratricopeptide repeat protein [Firmicutes bacterium]|nr:tetratricopeptide repeat protein [Bacillota bacterium]